MATLKQRILNTYSVFVGADEFILHQTIDIDADCFSCVDVYDANHKYIGEIRDCSIPDIEDEEAVIPFETEVTEWLKDNYYA